MNKIKETVEFIHKDIKVYVKIDYINNKISLVEPKWNLLSWKFQRKQWLFNERWVEYMKGWLNILDAQKYAIEEAKKLYEAELARVSKFTESFIILNGQEIQKAFKKAKIKLNKIK